MLDTLKAYLTQLRQEMAIRLLDRVYENGTVSKWWGCFAKRKVFYLFVTIEN